MKGKYTCVSFVYNSAHAQPHDSIQQQHQQKKKKSSSSWLCFEMVLRKFFDFFLYNNFLPPPNYIYSFNFENKKKRFG